jgi:hypothetical protein
MWEPQPFGSLRASTACTEITTFSPLSIALQPFVALWSFIQFVILFTQTVELLGRVISPSQGRYLHTGQHKHRINAHTDIRAFSGIRTHDPSIRVSKDSSCLRPRGHCDRLIYVYIYVYIFQFLATFSSEIVTGLYLRYISSWYYWQHIIQDSF